MEMPGGIDYELRERLHPEPASEEELEYMKHIDPTAAGIFLHKLHTIASEGNETLVKLGGSTGCRWGDTACAIYTTMGDNAVCATGLYFHAVLGQLPIKYIMKHWFDDPSVGVKPGDAFFSNDPFYAGVHAPDMGIFAPIFYKDKFICWVGAVIHSGECGACEPGGMPSGSRSIYDEGIQIPPMKIAENYVLREDVINAMNHMVRDPRAFTLDIKARMAALRIMEKRLIPVIEKVTPEYMMGVLRYVIELTGEAARKRISQWNDGKFTHVQFVDCVGILSRLMKIAITMEKKGDHLYFDLDGASPEVADRVINCHPLGVLAINMVYWLGHLFHDLPHNAGVLEPVSIRIPEGSIANASRECPKAGAPYVMETSSLIIQHLIQQAMYATSPERTECAGNRGFNTITYGGLNQYGEAFADVGAEMNGIGFGARSYKDGVDVAGAYFAPMTSEPGEVESLEAHLPFLYLYRGFHQDSCGHGKYRGGVGMDYAIKVHNVPQIFLGTWGFGSRMSFAQGVFGGYGIPALPFLAVSDSNLNEMLHNSDENIPGSSKILYQDQSIKGHYNLRGYPCVVEPTKEGDFIAGGTGGGGGYADPIERDPSLVMEDLENGVISHWAAKNVYRVAYDERRLAVDEEKTKLLREQERDSRKKKGKKFEEFEKEWLTKKPSDETLEFYGTWPESKYESFSYYGPWPGVKEKSSSS
jgi:N-methylhydantoinase B/oxoprolinase/acetone carboxylase alpha subunit